MDTLRNDRVFGNVALFCRGQGDALNVDRQDLYQALYSVLAAAPLGDLEPLRPRPGVAAGDEHDQAAAGGRGGPAGPSGRAAPAAEPGSQNRRRGWNAAEDASAEDLPFEVLLVRTAHQMLVEQVRLSSLVQDSGLWRVIDCLYVIPIALCSASKGMWVQHIAARNRWTGSLLIYLCMRYNVSMRVWQSFYFQTCR